MDSTLVRLIGGPRDGEELVVQEAYPAVIEFAIHDIDQATGPASALPPYRIGVYRSRDGSPPQFSPTGAVFYDYVEETAPREPEAEVNPPVDPEAAVAEFLAEPRLDEDDEEIAKRFLESRVEQPELPAELLPTAVAATKSGAKPRGRKK